MLMPAEAAAALERDADTVRGLVASAASEPEAHDEGRRWEREQPLSYDEQWNRADAPDPLPPAPSASGAAAATGAMRLIPGYKTTVVVIKPGASANDADANAAAVHEGDTVVVHAAGTVEQSGAKFWNTRDAGQSAFTYQAGVGAVITGWDMGVLGMTVGEVRRLRIPAEEGYGGAGFPAWGIPPGSTLLFEIEVLSIVKGEQRQ
jgi:hypothetical protein